MPDAASARRRCSWASAALEATGLFCRSGFSPLTCAALPLAHISLIECAPHRLAEDVRERPYLGDEGETAASDLTDGAAAHQHALRRRLPVHSPDLDLGVVPAAVDDVRLGDPARSQHALGILGIDREVAARAQLGGGEAALRLECGAVEDERSVVISEPEGHAVRARNPPAPGERRRAFVEMRLQAGIKRLISDPGSRAPAGRAGR
jgi:hypothetical protein